MNVQDRAKQVQSRGDFVAFVRELVRDHADHPEQWENGELTSFLEAMAAWVSDMDGYYMNRGEVPPEQPAWRTFAEILMAASVYE